MRTGLRQGIISILITFLSLLGAWLLLTFSLDPFSILLGAVFAFAISLFSYDLFIDRYTRLESGISGLIRFLLTYFFVLLKEIYLASIIVVYQVITLDISPGLVKIKTGLRSDFGQVVLANSITLTPGTATVDVSDDHLLVHWLKIETRNSHKAAEDIKGNYEIILKRIFK